MAKPNANKFLHSDKNHQVYASWVVQTRVKQIYDGGWPPS